MAAPHLEILVEEPSMEAFLQLLLPRILPNAQFHIIGFQGKHDMLAKLEKRLRAYAKHLRENSRIVVVVDQDQDSCHKLKETLEQMAARAGLRTRSKSGGKPWQVVNRIVIEELEAWYFGDWAAVRSAYPKMPGNTPRQAKYRTPDAIHETWEAFERIGQRHGYFASGLGKTEAARAIAPHIDPSRNSSHSFRKLFEALVEAGS